MASYYEEQTAPFIEAHPRGRRRADGTLGPPIYLTWETSGRGDWPAELRSPVDLLSKRGGLMAVTTDDGWWTTDAFAEQSRAGIHIERVSGPQIERQWARDFVEAAASLGPRRPDLIDPDDAADLWDGAKGLHNDRVSRFVTLAVNGGKPSDDHDAELAYQHLLLESAAPVSDDWPVGMPGDIARAVDGDVPSFGILAPLLRRRGRQILFGDVDDDLAPAMNHWMRRNWRYDDQWQWALPSIVTVALILAGEIAPLWSNDPDHNEQRRQEAIAFAATRPRFHPEE